MGVKATEVAMELGDLSPFDYFPFATYVEGRTNGGATYKSYYKRHKTLAHAKTAIKSSYHRETARLYEYNIDFAQWEEIAFE